MDGPLRDPSSVPCDELGHRLDGSLCEPLASELENLLRCMTREEVLSDRSVAGNALELENRGRCARVEVGGEDRHSRRRSRRARPFGRARPLAIVHTPILRPSYGTPKG